MIKELPSVAADWSNGDVKSAEKDHLSNGMSLQYTENGTNLRETQSMLLERIASEMNRLKFYITHSQVYLALFIILSLLAFSWLFPITFSATLYSQLLHFSYCYLAIILFNHFSDDVILRFCFLNFPFLSPASL